MLRPTSAWVILCAKLCIASPIGPFDQRGISSPTLCTMKQGIHVCTTRSTCIICAGYFTIKKKRKQRQLANVRTVYVYISRTEGQQWQYTNVCVFIVYRYVYLLSCLWDVLSAVCMCLSYLSAVRLSVCCVYVLFVRSSVCVYLLYICMCIYCLICKIFCLVCVCVCHICLL